MKSKYQSPNTVGKRQTVPIDVDDPRLKPDKIARTRARQGAEIEIVDVSSGANLTAVALSQGNASSSNGKTLSPDAVDFVASYDQVIKAIVNPGPDDPTGRPNVVNLGEVSITSCVWSGNNIVITFEFDSALSQNQYANEFIVHGIATNGSVGRSRSGYFKVNKTTTTQVITFTKDINIETMHGFTTSFSSFCIYAVDTIGANTGNEICVVSFPTYNDGLLAPTITVTSVNNGYSVSYTSSTASYSAIEIAEYESSATSEPTGVTYNTVYSNTFNPIVITSPNLNQRWVKARFVNLAGNAAAYSAAQKVTPTSVINVDLLPPNELSAVSASWNVSNGINITYTMPATDAGVRFIVNLYPVSNPSAQGSFYIYPTSTSGTQTLTITKSELFAQFGTYYTEFTGLIKSVDAADNRTSGVSFNVNSITNQLVSVTPNPTLTAIIDGYIVSVSNTTANVDHVEVYEYFLDPATMLDMMGTLMDYMDADYASGGASGANTIVLNNWQDQIQMSVVNPEYCEGMAITGIGIPDNTYITSITIGPSTNYTVHLSNNLTQQASGSYHMPSLVAAGNSPLSVYTGNYIKRWVVVVYYDIFGNNSLFGKANPAYVIPLNPTTSLFDTAVQITSTGALYLGSSKTSVPNVLIGTNSAEAGIFVWGPNDGTTTSDTPSTQIIGAANSPLTFITKNAQIADWLVTDTKIENTLSGTPTKYTGLSATGTYSFWAGSTVTGGNSSAKFTVTPLGAVTAREIYIVGTGDANSKLIDAGSNFYVKHDGSLYATSAEITGKITASSGSFTGNLTVGSSGSLTSGTVGAGSGNAGYILNTSGLRFDYGSTQGITQLVASTGQFITTKALIGGWTIDSSSITKTNSSGTLTLDSSNALIKATSAAYSAGIKTPTSNLASDVTFWAGYGQTPSTSSTFNVTADGTLRATNAILSGTVSSKGTYTITMDGARDAISFSSGTTIFARDSASTPGAVGSGTATFFTNSNPFNSSDPANAGYTTINTDPSTGLNSKPYIAIGGNKNSYGTTMEGIGLYSPLAYLNVTSANGIGMATQVSAVDTTTSQILLSGGELKINAGPNSSSPTTQIRLANQKMYMTSYGTGTRNSQISFNDTEAGAIQISSTNALNVTAAVRVTNSLVQMIGDASVTTANFVAVGDVSSLLIASDTTGTYTPALSTRSVLLQASNTRVNGLGSLSSGDGSGSSTSAYSGPSRIILDSSRGVLIYGVPVQGNIVMTKGSTYYRDVSPLGPYARQRMLVEDPVTGQVLLGMGVYYSSSSEFNGVPTLSSGYVGDLWVIY